MVFLIAAAAAAALSLPAAAADVLASIRARLDTHPVVRADFLQTRRIAALRKPLVTRGRVLASRADGVVWQVEEPYRATWILKADSTIEIADDGTRTRRSAQEAPAAARIGHAVRALVSGDTAALAEWFDVDAASNGPHWRVDLVPRQGSLADRVKSVRAGGATFVEEVGIAESNGDTTRIEFRNHRGGALTEAERRWFAAD